jgi:hypothetical protein
LRVLIIVINENVESVSLFRHDWIVEIPALDLDKGPLYAVGNHGVVVDDDSVVDDLRVGDTHATARAAVIRCGVVHVLRCVAHDVPGWNLNFNFASAFRTHGCQGSKLEDQGVG